MLGDRLAGLGCVIVGGTGGIGRASARRYLEEGARVVAAGSTETTNGAPEVWSWGEGLYWECGVRAEDEGEVAALFAFAREVLGGRIDVLFHVAGISGRRFGDGALDACTVEGWDRVMEVNARSVFLSNREAVRIMRAQERDASGARGVVINVGSVVDRSPSPRAFGTVAYAASKGAVRALTLGAAACYAAESIRFNLIEPGLVDTPMARRAVESEVLRPYVASKQPLVEGPVTALDVAEAAVFLASPAARGVTGATITVDGGWTVSEGQHGSS